MLKALEELPGVKSVDVSFGERKATVAFDFSSLTVTIEDDFAENGRSLIMERIMAEKKAGACDCAYRNPKGR